MVRRECVEQWGCVNVPALPLQLLLQRHPEWAEHPVAVVAEDRPQGEILWVNERARRCRILPGARYAAALSLAAELRAGVVGPSEIEAAVDALHRRLLRYTPEVEPSADEPGLSWLNASGFARLFPSLRQWADALMADLREAGYVASVVVGFDRFGTYALARTRRGALVLESAVQERRLAAAVPLHRLAIDPKLRDTLMQLGIDDVGAFRRLPAAGILDRFGAEGYRLHRLANRKLPAPLAPRSETIEPNARVELDPEQSAVDRQGLLFLVKQALGGLHRELVERGRAIAALRLGLMFEKGACDELTIRPAEPTLDEVQLVDLMRLRLESVSFDPLEFEGFELSADAVPATRKQLALFAEAPRRQLAAGNRALARLRAEFGDDAVARAVLRDGHLPEARFRWEPLDELRPAQPRDTELRLTRRILRRPRPLAQQRPIEDGWFVGGIEHGPVRELTGPFVIAGGWWRQSIAREYHFAETGEGKVFWLYLDRRRGIWTMHGVVG